MPKITKKWLRVDKVTAVIKTWPTLYTDRLAKLCHSHTRQSNYKIAINLSLKIAPHIKQVLCEI